MQIINQLTFRVEKTDSLHKMNQNKTPANNLNWLFPFAAGVSQCSLCGRCSCVEIAGRERKVASGSLKVAVERASCWFWNRQEELSWKLGEDGQ